MRKMASSEILILGVNFYRISFGFFYALVPSDALSVINVLTVKQWRCAAGRFDIIPVQCPI